MMGLGIKNIYSIGIGDFLDNLPIYVLGFLLIFTGVSAALIFEKKALYRAKDNQNKLSKNAKLIVSFFLSLVPVIALGVKHTYSLGFHDFLSWIFPVYIPLLLVVFAMVFASMHFNKRWCHIQDIAAYAEHAIGAWSDAAYGEEPEGDPDDEDYDNEDLEGGDG